jgi:hypothetical protein
VTCLSFPWRGNRAGCPFHHPALPKQGEGVGADLRVCPSPPSTAHCTRVFAPPPPPPSRQRGREFGFPPSQLVRVQTAGKGTNCRYKNAAAGEIFLRFLSPLRVQASWRGALGSESPLAPALPPLSNGGEGAGSGGFSRLMAAVLLSVASR